MASASLSRRSTSSPSRPPDTTGRIGEAGVAFDAEGPDPGKPIDHKTATDVDLVRLAYNADDRAAAEELKRRHPGVANLIRFGGGDLAHDVAFQTVERIFPKSRFRTDAVWAKYKGMRAELDGPRPTPLEKLLVDRVVVTWLDLYHREGRLIRSEGESMRVVEHRDRLRDRAHRRYLSAIRALAQLRRLAPPIVTIVTSQGGPQAIQVNP